MVVRIALMFVALMFLCIGIVYIAIGIHDALLLAFQPWAASLITAACFFIIAALFGVVGSHWQSRSAPGYGGVALGAASASISRMVGSSPIIAIGAAALFGLVQSLLFGRRR